MLGRSVLMVAAVIAAAPAMAAELKPEEARHFIAGKHFSYTCFEGTTGSGRINADGQGNLVITARRENRAMAVISNAGSGPG